MKARVLLCLAGLVIGLIPAAALPVPVAAEVEVVYSSEDTYIDQYYDDDNYGTAQYFKVGRDWVSPVRAYRGLLEFPVNWGTAIPSDAVIYQASLYIRYTGDYGDVEGRTIRVQRMLRPTWSETQATWNIYRSGYYWDTAGCAGLNDDYTTSGQADATVPASYGWMQWLITTQVQWAQTNDENILMRVIDATGEDENTWTYFAAREHSTYDPYIRIYYWVPPTVTTGTATSILDTTATLGGTITDVGGDNCDTRGFKYGLTQTPTWDVHEDGSFGTGAYTLGVTSLSPGTLYWFRAYATNGAGTDYGDWVSFTTLEEPTISTVEASNVAGTTARLNSALEDDGGADCTIKFGWGLSSESAIDDYDSTETLAGTYNTGQYPYLDVENLVAGNTYYFRVQATNVIGSTLGSELSFETPVVLDPPSNLVGYPEATTITLSWSKGSGSSNTLIRYGTTTYPTSTTSGTLAYLGPASTYTVTGLTSGKNYYFRAWGESGGEYSSTNTTLLMTTSPTGADAPPDVDVPSQPSRWFAAPNYTTMASLGPLYDGYNNALDTGNIPRETGWFLGALGLSMLFGLIAYLKLGKKLMIGMAVLTVCLAIGYFAQIIPGWVPIMSLILVITLGATHKQVAQG